MWMDISVHLAVAMGFSANAACPVFWAAKGECAMYSRGQILGGILFALVIIILGLSFERSGISYPVAEFDVVYVPIGLGVLLIGYITKVFYQKGWRWSSFDAGRFITVKGFIIALFALLTFLIIITSRNH
jgi:hypothetical protein